ncbi:Serine hydroxymethyltransferase-like domain [Arabidopsis thaliana x Arabidopsis arenosa]|uniref:Serine hydroxymethyltransferase-like domain n=1 Tax=Arabidopsis thaliana x Arabidopsis arenosa TaxID=1240361 RepID=A0A8T1ZMZ0_9BRAS|nr:Serine hydroxymethyltransferase-like domain [Arabidopsis thaliana x Arabidopsis arenosa]
MWRRSVSSHHETLAADVVADSPRRLTALCGELASEIEISGSAFSDLNSEWSLGACRGGVWDLDYASLRAIADKLGALLLCDMAHISGLISAQVLPITTTDNYILVEALVSHMSEIDEKQMLLYAQMANLVNLILQFPSVDLREISENFSKPMDGSANRNN